MAGLPFILAAATRQLLGVIRRRSRRAAATPGGADLALSRPPLRLPGALRGGHAGFCEEKGEASRPVRGSGPSCGAWFVR